MNWQDLKPYMVIYIFCNVQAYKMSDYKFYIIIGFFAKKNIYKKIENWLFAFSPFFIIYRISAVILVLVNFSCYKIPVLLIYPSSSSSRDYIMCRPLTFWPMKNGRWYYDNKQRTTLYSSSTLVLVICKGAHILEFTVPIQ